jgi:hypothetical protein
MIDGQKRAVIVNALARRRNVNVSGTGLRRWAAWRRLLTMGMEKAGPETPSVAARPDGRRAYEGPELRRLGSVRELTLSGGGSSTDNGGTLPAPRTKGLG